MLQPTDNDTLTITDSITDILSTLNDTITTLVDLNKTIKGDNFTMQVYHYDDIPSERDDVFSINLTQCEDILRNYYKYPSTENFIICKIDLYPENASTPQVEYQIYDSQGKPLEMKICDSITDDVSYPTVNASAIDFSLVSNLTAKGIDILNRSDPFFNDICSVNSIEERRELYQGNHCEDGCTYKGVNTTSKKIKCKCDSKEQIETNQRERNDNTTFDSNITLNGNFVLLSCYNNIFNWDNIKTNGGVFVASASIVFQSINVIICCLKGVKSLLSGIHQLHNKILPNPNQLHFKATNIDDVNTRPYFIKEETKLYTTKMNKALFDNSISNNPNVGLLIKLS